MGTLKVGTIEKANGDPVSLTKQEGVKAWANTNAAGVAINGSFNVSSLEDVGTGKQVIHVINSFENANYAPLMTLLDDNRPETWISAQTTSSYRTNVYSGSAYVDEPVSSAVHGDLA